MNPFRPQGIRDMDPPWTRQTSLIPTPVPPPQPRQISQGIGSFYSYGTPALHHSLPTSDIPNKRPRMDQGHSHGGAAALSERELQRNSGNALLQSQNTDPRTVAKVYSEIVTGYQAQLRSVSGSSVSSVSYEMDAQRRERAVAQGNQTSPIASYSAENESLRQKLRQVEIEKTGIEARFDAEQKKINAERRKIESDRQQYETVLDDLQKALENKDAELQQRNSDLETLRKSIPPPTPAANVEELAKKEQQLQHYKQRCDQLVKTNAIRQSESNDRILALEQRADKLDADLNVEHSRVLEMEKMVAEKDRLVERMVSPAKYENKQKELNNVQIRYEAAKNRCEGLKKDLEKTKKKLDDANDGCNGMVRHVKALDRVKKSLPKIVQSFQELKKEKDAIEKDAQALFLANREEIDVGIADKMAKYELAFKMENSSLRGELRQRESEIDMAVKEKTIVQKNLEKEQEENRARVAEFTGQLQQKEDELGMIRQEKLALSTEFAQKSEAKDLELANIRKELEEEKKNGGRRLSELSIQVEKKDLEVSKVRKELEEEKTKARGRTADNEKAFEQLRQQLNEEKEKNRACSADSSRKSKEKDQTIRDLEKTNGELLEAIEKAKRELEAQSKLATIKKESEQGQEEALRASNEESRRNRILAENLSKAHDAAVNDLITSRKEMTKLETMVADYKETLMKVRASSKTKEEALQQRIEELDGTMGAMKEAEAMLRTEMEKVNDARKAAEDQLSTMEVFRAMVTNYVEVFSMLQLRLEEYVHDAVDADLRAGVSVAVRRLYHDFQMELKRANDSAIAKHTADVKDDAANRR